MYQRNPLLVFSNYPFKGKLQISVYPDKTNREPHFHVHDRIEKGKKRGKNFFECCFAFKNPPHYENHGSIKGKLSSSDKKVLVELLTKNKCDFWKTLIKEWNRGDQHEQLSLDLPVPDYTKCY